MNENEPIKILLDALTGTLSDLSSKFERVVGSQDRLENHLSSIDKTITSQAAAMSTSRETIELIRKDLNAALETVKAVERQLQGDGHDLGVRGDLKELKDTAIQDLGYLKGQIRGDDKQDNGIRGDLKGLKETAIADLTYLKEKIDGTGKEDAAGETDIGIDGNIKFIRSNMGWVSQLSAWIRKPAVIIGLLIGMVVVIAGFKQGFDAFKEPFLNRPAQTQTVIQPTTPLNVKVTASSNLVSLAWLPSMGKDAGIVMYRILRNGELVGVAQTTSFVDDHVASNTVYCYSLQAVDSAGQLSPPSPLQCVTPGK